MSATADELETSSAEDLTRVPPVLLPGQTARVDEWKNLIVTGK